MNPLVVLNNFAQFLGTFVVFNNVLHVSAKLIKKLPCPGASTVN